MIRNGLITLCLALAATVAVAQEEEKDPKAHPLEVIPDKARKSPLAIAMQRIGKTDVWIYYHRPSVQGREVWGTELAPYGTDPHPWRAGANHNTVFEIKGDVLVEGEPLAAGLYGFHVILSEDEWTLVFSENANEHGSFDYDPAEDALRVSITPEDAPHREWLQFGFEDLSKESALCFLHWEKKRGVFRIEPVVERRRR